MEGETATSGGATHRAIVWHAPNSAAPPKLMAALAGRGIEAVRVQSPYGALAALCQAGRLASPAIVIVHPEALPDAVALLEAKSRYAPGARCWMYGPAANPALRAIVDSDVSGWGGAPKPEVVVRARPESDSLKLDIHREPPAPPAPRVRSAPPKLKLAGEGAPVPPAADPETSEETAKSPLLTPEELRMLLGDDEPGMTEQR